MGGRSLALAGVLCAAGCYEGANSPAGDAGGTTGSAGSGSASAEAETETEPSGTGTAGEESCVGELVGETPLRRLTREQLNNSVRDLFGFGDEPYAGIESDEKIGPFYSNAVAPISQLQVEQFMILAEDLAARAVENVGDLTGCAPGPACAASFIADLGRRAYRRPLTTAEQQALETIHAEVEADVGFAEGIRVVVATMLQSPHFLYHIESTTADGDDVATLVGFELASRLSFFLWSSAPDDVLLDAAESGALTENLRAEAERMLDDPRAKDTLASFHLQWLGLAELDGIEKDAVLHPEWDAGLRSSMAEEVAAFATHVIRNDDAKLATLLTADYTIARGSVLDLYGIAEDPGRDPAQPLAIDAERRAGLVTLPGVMATHAHAAQSSPVVRGVLVRENFLCDGLPPPPPNVDNTPPALDPDATTRERFDEHSFNPACASCHLLIDGLGLGFEHYDAVGAWRETENGKPIDASGTIVDSDVDGEFDGAVELAHMLAESAQVRDCVAGQWFRFALGRTISDDDACAADAIRAQFEESEGDIGELIIGIVMSNAFRSRRVQ